MLTAQSCTRIAINGATAASQRLTSIENLFFTYLTSSCDPQYADISKSKNFTLQCLQCFTLFFFCCFFYIYLHLLPCAIYRPSMQWIKCNEFGFGVQFSWCYFIHIFHRQFILEFEFLSAKMQTNSHTGHTAIYLTPKGVRHKNTHSLSLSVSFHMHKHTLNTKLLGKDFFSLL